MAGANISISDSGWTKEGISKLWFSETFLKSFSLKLYHEQFLFLFLQLPAWVYGINSPQSRPYSKSAPEMH
jgi:hypothetical protein